MADKGVRIVVTWDGKGLRVQANRDETTAIATLEMAKALLLQKVVKPGRTYGDDKAQFNVADVAQMGPSILARQVDR